MLKNFARVARLIGLLALISISQLATAQKDSYPFGYLDSAGIVKIDSRIGASRAELDCLKQLKMGRWAEVADRSRKFIDAKGDDFVAWFLLIEASISSKSPFQLLLKELEARAHSDKSEEVGQRFRLILWHASMRFLRGSGGSQADVHANWKYATSGVGQLYRPASPCEAFLLFDYLDQIGQGMQRRDLLRYSVNKFGDYRLKLMLARSLDQAAGAYLNVPPSGRSPKEALQIAKAAHIEHPQDPVATYMYGMLLSERRQKSSVAVLQKYLKMEDVSERRRSKAKAALARSASGKG